VHKRLEAQKLKLELSTAARAQLITEGFDPAFGARPLRRTIQRRILNPLSQKVLAQELTAGDTVCVDVVDGQFVMSRRIADAVSANGATSGASKSRRRKAATV
jgi:ATP-dependent Clp protease ATP-binding subunit ClpA